MANFGKEVTEMNEIFSNLTATDWAFIEIAAIYWIGAMSLAMGIRWMAK